MKAKKPHLLINICAIIVCFFPFLVHAQANDRFAEIGNKASATRTHLLEAKVPSPLPNILLPYNKTNKGGFAAMNRLDTPEELSKELQKQRSRFLPFLKDLAPPMAQTRESVLIKKFDWRIETQADKKDFFSVANGAGSWQPVSIPHYGPPLGKATTYYRTAFTVSPSMIQKGSVFIVCKAVDYKAHLFINGNYIGSHEGAFAAFEFDLTDRIKEGENQLLIKVENDYPMLGHVGEDGRKLDGDKVYAATGLGYDEPELGWHHNPPGMGITQDVIVEARQTLHINDIFVRPLGDSDTAEVWLEVNNTELNYRGVKIRHSLYGQNFKYAVYQNAVYYPETVQIPGIGDLVKPTDWARKQLKMGKGVNFLRFRILIPNAKRWDGDQPWLYQLQLTLLDENDVIKDQRKQHFGMRSFRMDTVSKPKGAMYLNNEFIRLRGANTMGSFMQNVKQKNWQQLIDDILLAKIANMNYIRMTQFPVQPEVYDYCDKLGLMTQTDLPLFGVLRRNKWAECVRQTEEMERLVRSHPCNIMVSYINERFPNAEGMPQRHFDNYADFEKFFTAADQAVLLNNPDRVIKAGDGDYDPPTPGLPDNHCYNGWYNGHGLGLGQMYQGYWIPVKPDWYYACGEFGSEGLDPLNTMQEFYPKQWLPTTKDESNWTPNQISMSQTYRFHYMWFNRQNSVKDWIAESQKHQAWVTRLTAETFRRNTEMVSFAIHLFIDAWPAGWMKSIMDVKRQPKKAYFEYSHALQPLAVSLRSDKIQFSGGEKMQVEAWICNDKNKAPAQSTLRYQWEQAGKVIGAGNILANIPINSSKFQGFITTDVPLVKTRTALTLRLQLVNKQAVALHETDLVVTVFPAPVSFTKKIWLAGAAKASSTNLLNQLGATITTDPSAADVLLIENVADYQKQKDKIDSWVNDGKIALFLEPGAGKFVVDNDSVVVFKTLMGQYYFASPSLENPRMKMFSPDDFKLWYNANKSVISPILGEMSMIKGWESLLKSGQTGWVGATDYAFAAAEKKRGKGYYRINHLQLDGRVIDNATAKDFARLLLSL